MNRAFNLRGAWCPPAATFGHIYEVEKWAVQWLGLEVDISVRFVSLSEMVSKEWGIYHSGEYEVGVSSSIGCFVERQLLEVSEWISEDFIEIAYESTVLSLLSRFGLEAISSRELLVDEFLPSDAAEISFPLSDGSVGRVLLSAAVVLGCPSSGDILIEPLEMAARSKEVEITVKKRVGIRFNELSSLQSGKIIPLGSLENFQWELHINNVDISRGAYLGRSNNKLAVVVSDSYE